MTPFTHSPARRALLWALLFAAPGTHVVGATATQEPDGYLSRRVELVVYPSDPQFEQSPRGWTLQREVSLFEGYLWRNSLRHLAVETRVTVIHRSLDPEEFRDYGAQFGFMLDRSPKVNSDLKARGIEAPSLILLYVPPPAKPARLAGRTFYEGGHSSIPLKEVYFQENGFFRPLHLVMAHEYLHQIDLEFSKLHLPGEFLDPDGAGLADYPPCIDSGGGDLSLRTLLQFNRDCRQVRWELLSPAYGAWIPR
ncbi:MAG: hypothetical protein L0170_15365 [Acidobacteria bacterium]|nr:hypothetical protein [Acidobacteriota bacterium]